MIPSLSHVFNLAAVGNRSLRGTLIMQQLRIWRIHDPIVFLNQPQAVVHVLEASGKILFVEPAHRVKHVAPCHKARARYRGTIARQLRKHEVVVLVRGQEPEGVPGDAVNPEDHACVLDSQIGKQQQCPNRAYLIPLGMFQQSLKPVWVHDHGIIIEEQQIPACRSGRAGVTKRAKIKRRADTVQDGYTRVTPQSFTEEGRYCTVAGVVDHHDGKVLVCALFQYRVYRLSDQGVAAGRDDNTDFRGSANPVLHTVAPRAKFDYLRILSAPLEMLREDAEVVELG